MTAKDLMFQMTQKGYSISERMAIYILKGEHRPSAKLAIKLEDATGVVREAWMWPSRYHNPYIKKAS